MNTKPNSQNQNSDKPINPDALLNQVTNQIASSNKKPSASKVIAIVLSAIILLIAVAVWIFSTRLKDEVAPKKSSTTSYTFVLPGSEVKLELPCDLAKATPETNSQETRQGLSVVSELRQCLTKKKSLFQFSRIKYLQNGKEALVEMDMDGGLKGGLDGAIKSLQDDLSGAVVTESRGLPYNCRLSGSQVAKCQKSVINKDGVSFIKVGLAATPITGGIDMMMVAIFDDDELARTSFDNLFQK